MKRIAFVVVASILLTHSLAAQDSPKPVAPDVASETVQVNLVEIPVNVFDRQGNAVRGLKPENFEVYDDGKKRKITHFEEINLATIATTEVETTFNPAARRNFLIIFDLSNSSQRGLERAREAAADFVSGALKPRDLVAVANFTVEEGVTFLTSFTTDRELAVSAVRGIGSIRFVQSRDPLLLAALPDIGLTQYSPVDDAGGFETEERVLDKIIQGQLQAADDRFSRARVERQLRTFGELAKMLDRVRGRKQVILLSEGFDSRLVQGREKVAMSGEEAVWHLRGEYWRFDADDRFGSTRTIRELDDMSRFFRRSDVILHAIDVKGLRGVADARSGSQRTEISSESLYLLADGTGGEVFKNTNDLEESFARMLKQQEVVYILGFQTRAAGSPGKFHDLKVRVNVVGYSGLRVTHRAGYYEPQVQMRSVEQLLSATDILMNDIPFDEVEAHVLATAFPRADGRASVPVVIEIGGESLLRMIDGDTVNGEIFVYAFDRQNSVKDYLFQTVSIDLRQIRTVLRGSGLKYYGVLSLPPGEYTIKTLVRVAESGMNGFRRVHLKVPAAGEPSILSPLFFEPEGKWIMLRGIAKAEGEVAYPFAVAGESFIPAAFPALVPGERQKLALFTYNIPVEELRLSAIVRSETGASRNVKLDLLGRTSADEHGGVKLLLDFASADLLAGDYVLDVTVRNAASEFGQTVSIPLRIASP